MLFGFKLCVDGAEDIYQIFSEGMVRLTVWFVRHAYHKLLKKVRNYSKDMIFLPNNV